MFTSGGPKQYPQLARYLDQDLKRGEPSPLDGALRASTGFAVAATLFALVTLAAISPLITAPIALVAIATRILIGRKANAMRRKPSTAEIEAKPVKVTLHKSLFDKRLELDTPVAIAALLEECARLSSRIDVALNSPTWNSDQLPAHYVRAREQIRDAAAHAMNEIIVTISPAVIPTDRKPDWRDVAEDVIDKVVFNRKSSNSGAALPSEFHAARELAEKLRDLANEVETAKNEVSEFQAIPKAQHSIDAALSDLRSIKDAEDELRQNLQSGA